MSDTNQNGNRSFLKVYLTCLIPFLAWAAFDLFDLSERFLVLLSDQTQATIYQWWTRSVSAWWAEFEPPWWGAEIPLRPVAVLLVGLLTAGLYVCYHARQDTRRLKSRLEHHAKLREYIDVGKALQSEVKSISEETPLARLTQKANDWTAKVTQLLESHEWAKYFRSSNEFSTRRDSPEGLVDYIGVSLSRLDIIEKSALNESTGMAVKRTFVRAERL